MPKSNDEEEEDLDEDAFEALFNQLEQDLKNDGLTLDDNDDDISEEDLARLERELEEALGGDDLEMFAGPLDNSEVDDHAEAEDGGDDDDDVESPVELKRWQLRRLAVALKAGRRKTRIKSLAAELCLDRSIILELLRDPPPNLLLMSATLPDEPAQVRTVLEAETAPIDVAPHETTADAADPEPEPKPIEKVPLHLMRQRWSAQKRLKKVQVETLERVYRRTKRPTVRQSYILTICRFCLVTTHTNCFPYYFLSCLLFVFPYGQDELGNSRILNPKSIGYWKG